jgi:2'-5' RNA ligase
MYFAAVLLPPELDEKVLRLKKMMREKFGCTTGLKSPAHITLISPFWMDEAAEADFMNDVDSIGHDLSGFEICTNNFSAFVPRTIFIATIPNDQLDDMKHAVDEDFSNRTQYRIKKDTRPFHPHITIATRDLSRKDFYEAWPLFADKKFTESWIVGSISVLKHNKKNWDVVHISQFKNL